MRDYFFVLLLWSQSSAAGSTTHPDFNHATYQSDTKSQKAPLVVAAFGDSHFRDFYIEPSQLGMARQIRAPSRTETNLILSNGPNPNPQQPTVADRLAAIEGNVDIRNYAGAGARTDRGKGNGFKAFLTNNAVIEHFPEQIRKFRQDQTPGPSPDLYLFWFAGNHLDWIEELGYKYSKEETEAIVKKINEGGPERDRYFNILVANYISGYKAGLRRLLRNSKNSTRPSAYVIYEFPESESWRQTMKEIKEARDRGETTDHPYIDESYLQVLEDANYPSTVLYVKKLNRALRNMANVLRAEMAAEGRAEQVHIEVSGALHDLNYSREIAHKKDARHIGPEAIGTFSGLMVNGLNRALEHLKDRPPAQTRSFRKNHPWAGLR